MPHDTRRRKTAMARIASEKVPPAPCQSPLHRAYDWAIMASSVDIDGFVILVDDEDMRHFTARRSWRVSKIRLMRYLRWQTRRNGKTVVVSFHRLVMSAGCGQVIDHINGNTLDNRKENLRFVSSSQNARNKRKKSAHKMTSRFKGVSINSGRWRATIRADGGPIYLGRYTDEVEAAFMYDCASLKYHGEYGSRNFLPLVV